MPYEGNGEGTFTPGGSDFELHFRVESWVRQGDYPDREKTIDTENLDEVDIIVIEVWGEDREEGVEFETIWGPFDSWTNIEDFLSYDFGEDGSLGELFISVPR